MEVKEERNHSNRASRVLLIVPCYNEESNVLPLYKSILSALPYQGMDIDVLFIDDCSKDDTRVVMMQNNIPHIALPVNLGIGGAVQTGIKYAHQFSYDWIVQMDGDGQHPPAELCKFFETIKMDNVDLVIGSRFIEKKGFQSTLLRRIGIQFFSTLIYFLSGTRITDATSGYRMMGSSAIERACSYYPDEYPEPEILLDGLLRGYKVVEIPVQMKDRQGGASSIRSFFQVYYMLKVSLSMFFHYLSFKINK